MAREMIPVDVTHAPEILRLAEEVRSSKIPRVLRGNGEEIAVLTPLSPARKRGKRSKTYAKADDEAFLAAAGGWSNFDVDKFIKGNEESRRRSSRPPVDL
jgi:hypothetical protein